ncbi:hypothetical protein I5Q34_19765 [Streptomyces sp. AV19]|uniref:hypothetical protein n=1 Tax=Streptomyces sp. AV19 TaxID=2793068 RepID=UPI0018FE8A70|nr:hypothetical protein [Streptomyces sp. AV19]MBH1936486.1 hypothetical protein [Streptomyces sp. AV19]MDG4532543.1 hypothetical protein [Streptomyces sp. AV19]
MRDYLNRALGLVGDDGRPRDPFDGMTVRRAAQEGARDVGDVHAPPFVLECKDVRSPAVPTWLHQAQIEADHAGFPFGAVVHKTRGAPVAAGRVHVSVRTWTHMRQGLGMPADDCAGLYGWVPTVRGLDTARWYFTTTLCAFADLLDDYRSAMGMGVVGRAVC